MTRAYTISEIDSMRSTVRFMLTLQNPMRVYGAGEFDKLAEDRVRTYMMAGVLPEDLAKEAVDLHKMRDHGSSPPLETPVVVENADSENRLQPEQSQSAIRSIDGTGGNK